MSDADQTSIAPRFAALFQDVGQRLSISRKALIERHERAEDMAMLLSDRCQALCRGDGIDPDDVLGRCHAGLSGDTSALSPAEAWWIVHRTAELLGWTWRSAPPAPNG